MGNRNFSKARLSRIHEVMSGYVERGQAPGVVSLVSRHGETHVDVVGNKALDGPNPMQRDTIFRIASVTKPITAVAAMILVEECKLRLDDPVDSLLPELAGREVLKSLDGPVDDTIPAHRPITVRDLLRFTAGYGVILAPPDTYPIQRVISELEIAGFGPPDPTLPHSPDEWLARLGTLPLMHQPGEQWMYNTGSYILGVLIARAAGQPFETFLHERIFGPLGMRDTGFCFPPEKLDRLASSYWTSFETGALEFFDGQEDSYWSRPPVFPDGGAGLVSTVDDLLAFARMMLNKGAYDGTRILSRPSVEFMTADRLTPGQRAATDGLSLFLDGRSWGFGVSVVTHRDGLTETPGKYGWDGGLGTSWQVDPVEDLVTILLTQASFTSPEPPAIIRDFWTTAYRALDD